MGNIKTIAPLVSVVIPTRNRPHLVTRAVRSALSQTLDGIEVIVVIDGHNDATLLALSQIDDPRLRVKTLPRNVGGGLARNAGVNEAKGRWVAFLDDDDEWFPQKLEIQLQTAKQSHHRYPLVSCRLIGRSATNDFVWPKRTFGPTEILSEYLLCRKTLFWGGGVMQTSTIFTTKELLRKVPFRSGLLKHEDLDWILQTSTLEGVGVEFVPTPEPLAIWHIEGLRDKASNRPDWHLSFDWIQEVRHLVTPRAYVSFLMTWVSSSAAREGDWKAVLSLLREAYRYSKPSLMDFLVFWGNWLLPQKVQRQAAALFSRSGG